MPTFLFFKGGKKVDEVVGANAGSIRSKISQHASGSSFPGTGNRLGGNSSGISAISSPFIRNNASNILVGILAIILLYRILSGGDFSSKAM